MNYDQKINNVFADLTSFAAAIVDDEYLFEVSGRLAKAAGSLVTRDIPDLKAQIAEIGALSPQTDLQIPTSTDVAVKLLSTLSDNPDTLITGIPAFDRKFGGFTKKTLTLLAARPSMGKTGLALQTAYENAIAGRSVIYFSPEMASEKLFARLALGDAKIPAIKYKTRTMTEGEQTRLVDSINRLVEKLNDNLLIDDRSTITSADIWQAASRERPDMIVVDHLGLLQDKNENNVRRLGDISWTGKAIAKEFNCASLYLCQLSRGVEQRENKRPMMSDLRDSGELEQNADVVLFIHRPDYYNNSGIEVGVSPTELLIGKDRDGIRNGMVKCTYNLSEQRFYGEARE
jgi:replicative DNA helicase